MIVKKSRLYKQLICICLCTSFLLCSIRPKKVEAFAITSTAVYIALMAAGVLGLGLTAVDQDRVIGVGKEIVDDVKDIAGAVFTTGQNFVNWVANTETQINNIAVGDEIPKALILGAGLALLKDQTSKKTYDYTDDFNAIVVPNVSYHLTSNSYRTSSYKSYFLSTNSTYLYLASNLNSNYSTWLSQNRANIIPLLPTAVYSEWQSISNSNGKTLTLSISPVLYAMSQPSLNTNNRKVSVRTTLASNDLYKVSADGTRAMVTIPKTAPIDNMYSDFVYYNGVLHAALFNTTLSDQTFSYSFGTASSSNNVVYSEYPAEVVNGTLLLPIVYNVSPSSSSGVTSPTVENVKLPITAGLMTQDDIYAFPVFTGTAPYTQSRPIINTTGVTSTVTENTLETTISNAIPKPVTLPNDTTINNQISNGLVQTGDTTTDINTSLILGSINAGVIDNPVVIAPSIPDIQDVALTLPDFPTFQNEFPNLGDLVTGAGISALFAWLGERITAPIGWVISSVSAITSNMWANIKAFFKTALDTIVAAITSIGTAILDLPNTLKGIWDSIMAIPSAIATAITGVLTSAFALDTDLVMQKIDALVVKFKNRFPIFQDIQDMFTNVSNSLTNPTPPNFNITLPATMGGTTHSIFDVTFIDPYMATFRNITSIFTWLYFGWRFSRKITSIKS